MCVWVWALSLHGLLCSVDWCGMWIVVSRPWIQCRRRWNVNCCPWWMTSVICLAQSVLTSGCHFLAQSRLIFSDCYCRGIMSGCLCAFIGHISQSCVLFELTQPVVLPLARPTGQILDTLHSECGSLCCYSCAVLIDVTQHDRSSDKNWSKK